MHINNVNVIILSSYNYHSDVFCGSRMVVDIIIHRNWIYDVWYQSSALQICGGHVASWENIYNKCPCMTSFYNILMNSKKPNGVEMLQPIQRWHVWRPQNVSLNICSVRLYGGWKTPNLHFTSIKSSVKPHYCIIEDTTSNYMHSVKKFL